MNSGLLDPRQSEKKCNGYHGISWEWRERRCVRKWKELGSMNYLPPLYVATQQALVGGDLEGDAGQLVS